MGYRTNADFLLLMFAIEPTLLNQIHKRQLPDTCVIMFPEYLLTPSVIFRQISYSLLVVKLIFQYYERDLLGVLKPTSRL